MNNFLVFDIEYSLDGEGHALYQAAERFDPDGIERTRDNDPRTCGRWVFKRPVCISWMMMERVDGHLTPGMLHTASMPEMEEAELLTRFFQALNELSSDVQLVTWGGSASDIPCLEGAAAVRRGVG